MEDNNVKVMIETFSGRGGEIMRPLMVDSEYMRL